VYERQLLVTTQFFFVVRPLKTTAKGKDGEDETYWEYVPNYGAYGVPYGTIVPKNSSLHGLSAVVFLPRTMRMQVAAPWRRQ
jgi:hypothetical protein